MHTLNHLDRFTRRQFLRVAATGVGGLLLPGALRAAGSGGAPTNDPTAHLKLAWTGNLKWANAVDVTKLPGQTITEQLANAQALLAANGGGTVWFPPGTYRFTESIQLQDGIILRGADPGPVTSAHNEKYALPTRFEFPKYEASFEGAGTPVLTAFKGLYVETPATASHCGVVNLDLNRGHVHFAQAEGAQCGSNRIVFGCILRNTAVPDPAVPNPALGQKPWQRFTQRHFAAIDVKVQANGLIANNRLPLSGDDNFTMNEFVLRGAGKVTLAVDGVVFDYDNRPGIYLNHFGIGGAGGAGDDGTPETHPHGFRQGLVVRDNYIFNTGRMGIGFCGDGVRCLNNVIRIQKDVWRPTVTGQQVTSGASTNDNRAVEMRGWRWLVEGNDYEVHRNISFNRGYHINDGEGLMHEDHVNSIIRDSVLTNNHGNTYLSLYKTGGIDGLRVEGNDIRVAPAKKGGGIGAIYVDANRNSGKHPCRNVAIVNNLTGNGGILIAGDPAEHNVVKGNRYVGEGRGTIRNQARARIENNNGYDVVG